MTFTFHWPVDAAAEGDQEVGEGGDLLEPLGGLLGVGGVELAELPGVGHPAHAVAHDEQAHYGQADLGLTHLDNTFSSVHNLISVGGALSFTSMPLLLKLILSPTMLLMLGEVFIN